MNKRTKQLAVSSLLAALSFTILYLGTLTGVLDLCAVVVGALCVVFAKIEMGKWHPLAIAFVTFTLAVVLLPDKFVAFEYLFLGGIYPLVKHFAESNGRRKLTEWVVKLVYFNTVFAVILVLSMFVFVSSDSIVTADSSSLIIAAVVLFCNAAFIIYDIAMTKFISYYFFILRKKLKIRDLR